MTSRALALSLAVLVGCTVGPDYRRPDVAVPAAYKEAPKEPGWQPARPADASDRGAWWSVYNDPVLDRLEQQVDISNQNLKAAEAAFRQSEAVVAQARAAFFPTAAINAQGQRSRNATGRIANQFSLSVAASWIPDLWGRVTRSVESQVANAQANAADLASARLAVQGQLAADYVQLRFADELKRLLDASAAAFAESLRISENQYRAGTAAASDVAQARTQLQSTQAQVIAVGVTRAQLEHAIAVLIGRPPAEVTIAPVAGAPPLPAIPAGLPSVLLQRRPDIAAAERQVAAVNAQIGVAEAAFYPTITLSANTGTTASQIGRLLSASNLVWSFGTSLAQTIFDAGARQAQLAQARAAWEGSIADYRQTVLTAFQQVEDQLAALRILEQQAAAEELALTSAREAERIITNQYRAGTVAYTSVVVAQTAALNAAQSALTIRQNRVLASVALIQALGGGWDAARLPSRERIEADSPLNFSPIPASGDPPRP